MLADTEFEDDDYEEMSEIEEVSNNDLLSRLINIIENCECIKFVGTENVRSNKNPNLKHHHLEFKSLYELRDMDAGYGNDDDDDEEKTNDKIYENLHTFFGKVGDDFYFLNNGDYKYDFWDYTENYKFNKSEGEKAPGHSIKIIDNKEYFKIEDIMDGGSFIMDILFMFIKIDLQDIEDDWLNIILNSMRIDFVFTNKSIVINI